MVRKAAPGDWEVSLAGNFSNTCVVFIANRTKPGPSIRHNGVKVMNLKHAWGWLMAGVVAAGFNASYHDGGLQWAHQAAERITYNTRAVLALASGNAEDFLTQAKMVTARNETASCPLSA